MQFISKTRKSVNIKSTKNLQKWCEMAKTSTKKECSKSHEKTCAIFDWLLLLKKFKFLCKKLVIFQIRFLRNRSLCFRSKYLKLGSSKSLAGKHVHFLLLLLFFFHLLCSYNNVVNYCEENRRRKSLFLIYLGKHCVESFNLNSFFQVWVFLTSSFLHKFVTILNRANAFLVSHFNSIPM